jgi:hypothetical protein
MCETLSQGKVYVNITQHYGLGLWAQQGGATKIKVAVSLGAGRTI